MIKQLFVLAIFLIFGPSSDHLLISWVDDGALWVWQAGESRLITDGTADGAADGNIIRPIIAPGGQHIAFTRGTAYQEESLWLISIDGTDERKLVTMPAIAQVVWADDSTLYFNTLDASEMGNLPRDDLFRVDIKSDEPSDAVLPIETGGSLSISPDGNYLIVIQPGTYNEADGHLFALSTTDPTALPIELLAFPAISTGSHFAFYPDVQWQDEHTILVAIPEADALYKEVDPASEVTTNLWRIVIGEPAEQIGTLNAGFFNRALWSGDRLVYMKRGGDDFNTFTTYMAELDGSNAQPLFIEEGIMPETYWLSDTLIYFYGNQFWTLDYDSGLSETWLKPEGAINGRTVGPVFIYQTFYPDTRTLQWIELGDDEPTNVTNSATILYFDALLLDAD